jgi:hypothetical protein
LLEAHNKGAGQSKSRYAISWTSKDSDKINGQLYVVEGRGLRKCGEVFFILQGKPAFHNPGAKCDLSQDYTALGAMAGSYSTTGETLNVTDVYVDGQQMIEFYHNTAMQSKTRFKAAWSGMDSAGNLQGKVFADQGGKSCGSIVFSPKDVVVFFDSKNPCGLSNIYKGK